MPSAKGTVARVLGFLGVVVMGAIITGVWSPAASMRAAAAGSSMADAAVPAAAVRSMRAGIPAAVPAPGRSKPNPAAAAADSPAGASLPFTTQCHYAPANSADQYDVLAGTPLSFNLPVSDWEWKRRSQYGEDGIIERINVFLDQEFDGTYIEFGVEGGQVECNTLYLRLEKRWTGLMMDGLPENLTINKRQAMITPDNVCELFRRFDAARRANILSVDTDQRDYWLLKSILECGYSADMVIVELNTLLFGPKERVTYAREGGLDIWDGTSCFGMSLQAATLLLHKYGYTLVYVESNGLNAFYANNDKLGGRCVRDEDLATRTALMWRRATYNPHPDRVCEEPEIVRNPPV